MRHTTPYRKNMGCKPDRRAETARKRMTTHGATSYGIKPPEWVAWCNMRHRCNDKNRPDYHRYGGRGINFCKRWEKFSNFLADMGKRPAGMTLERIDNDKGYSPSNCEWADRKAQRINQSSRVLMVTFAGQTMCLKDWAKKLGVNYGTLQSRRQREWPLAKMLMATPMRGTNQYNSPRSME